MPKNNPSAYLKPPEKGKKPKKITTTNEPGGSMTPGAKKERAKTELEKRLAEKMGK